MKRLPDEILEKIKLNIESNDDEAFLFTLSFLNLHPEYLNESNNKELQTLATISLKKEDFKPTFRKFYVLAAYLLSNNMLKY